MYAGDAAAYVSLSSEEEAVDNSKTPLTDQDSLSINPGTPISPPAGSEGSHFVWPQRQAGPLERLIGPEYIYLGLVNGYRYRYKHAILNDHVCTPGEAYIEFVCTLEGRQGEGTASKLLQWAERSAEKLGCGSIRLTVMGPNPRLKAGYERIGYSDCRSWMDPVELFFMRYVFGIKEDEYFEMEKPIGMAQGVAIYSQPYGFTSDRVIRNLSDSSDGDPSLALSLHGAAQYIVSGTRGVLSSAQEFLRVHSNPSGGFTVPAFRSGDVNFSRIHFPLDCLDRAEAAADNRQDDELSAAQLRVRHGISSDVASLSDSSPVSSPTRKFMSQVFSSARSDYYFKMDHESSETDAEASIRYRVDMPEVSSETRAASLISEDSLDRADAWIAPSPDEDRADMESGHAIVSVDSIENKNKIYSDMQNNNQGTAKERKNELLPSRNVNLDASRRLESRIELSSYTIQSTKMKDSQESEDQKI